MNIEHTLYTLGNPMQPGARGTSSHALVIGSGFGGLAAAVRLGARGYRVTVLELHDQPGGRARVFRRAGYTFDAGPTVITAPFLFEELWALAGRRLSDDVDLRPVSPFYRIRFNDGQVFNYTGDPEAMRAEVQKLAPADVHGYERFLLQSERIFNTGFEKLAHMPFGSWLDMAKIMPDMVKLQSFRTVYGLVARYVRDERLRQVLSFHPLLVGGNPFTTTSIYSLIPHLERKWGVHFPIGGTGALVRGLVQLIEHQGGSVRYGCEVNEILVHDKRASGVRLTNGEVIPADVVVSNADSAYTYRSLVRPEHRRTWTDKRLSASRYSMSLFVWYFGCRRKYEDVAHHTILLGPRYRELLTDIFSKQIVPDDFSLYLHRPTATDSSLAPPGCDAFYVLSPVAHLASGVNWEDKAESYRRRIAEHLERTLMPGLQAATEVSFMMTPQHFQDDLRSVEGAAFGLEPVLTQSAYFRPHNQSEDIAGLYLVGAGTHPGAGVPGVLSSARVLDRLVPHAAA